MSKITKALDKAERDRDLKAGFLSGSNVGRNKPIRNFREGTINNAWLVWVFFIGIVVVMLVAFNIKKGSDAVPLTEIFPEEEVYPIDVEYEFVDDEGVIKNVIDQKPAVKVQQKQANIEATKVVASKPVIQEETKQAAVTQPDTKPVVEAKIEPVNVTSLSNVAYTIQVASFKLEAKANVKLKELQDKGYAGFVLSRNLGDKGTWYRVYVGRFGARDGADNYLKKVKADYPDSFIISPKK